MKTLIVVVLLGLAAVPVAAIATMLLYPLWSWIEATYGIESIGHSGPADWCFMLIYGLLLAVLLLFLWRRWRRDRVGSKLA